MPTVKAPAAEATHARGGACVLMRLWRRLGPARWQECKAISAGGKKWDATKLGPIMATEIFEPAIPECVSNGRCA
jgi:hypothetical protein